MSDYRIGDVVKMLGLTADTLRYYEKLGLLTAVARNNSGIRIYTDKNISQLRFIQRAQKMNFSLAEIKDLLLMRKDPQHARKDVRELTNRKLAEIGVTLQELTTLQAELRLLINLCLGSDNGCPIIEGIDDV